MKIKNLISKLQQYDDEADVLVRGLDDTGDVSNVDIGFEEYLHAPHTLVIIPDEIAPLSFERMETGE